MYYPIRPLKEGAMLKENILNFVNDPSPITRGIHRLGAVASAAIAIYPIYVAAELLVVDIAHLVKATPLAIFISIVLAYSILATIPIVIAKVTAWVIRGFQGK